jgi:hypothetical protein
MIDASTNDFVRVNARFAGATGRVIALVRTQTHLRGAHVDIAVWIASGLLAAAYLFAGGTKLLTPKERLAKNPSMAGAAEAFSATSIKLIGGVEVGGALGLILPWLTGIAGILTPAAAVVLALLQVFIAAARTAEVVR